MTDASPPPGSSTSSRAGCVGMALGLGFCCLVVLGGTALEAYGYAVQHCLGGCSYEVQQRVSTRFVHHMLLASLCIPVAMIIGMWLIARATTPRRRPEDGQPS